MFRIDHNQLYLSRSGSADILVVSKVKIGRLMNSGKNRHMQQFRFTRMARKAFVTLLLACGVRPEGLMSFTGHRSFKTMKRYIAHTEKSRKEEMDRVWG